MIKLSDNPPILPVEFAAVADVPGPWWIGHTKARFEKAFAWDLSTKRIPYFLPMIQQVKFSGGRKRHLMMPLFTGYVFFAGDGNARYEALATNRLANVIEVKDQQQLVAELASIHRVLSAGRMQLDPYPYAAVGKRVRVAAGPLEGIEGVVIERKDVHARLVLQVSMLGQGAALEIEPSLLEPT